MVKRTLEDAIMQRFFQRKAILLTGPRQVGKTTLLQHILGGQPEPFLWLNCDEPTTRESLQNVNLGELRLLIGRHKIICIDEAQRVENIGLTLKLMVDQFPEIQVLATGSSAFELANQVNEPLTGRKFSFQMLPFSTDELVQHTAWLSEKALLEQRILYGFYPEIVLEPADAPIRLLELTSSYLYKDLLVLQDIRKPAVLNKLLIALALQIGSEVSSNELAQTVGSDRGTVDRYIDLLEKAFVLFQVSAFSRNLRNELKKARKIYFYDTGIRNALINNFTPLALRNDTGALWENFIVAERLKYLSNTQQKKHFYFWRTVDQQEIDWIEEADGQLLGVEFKWNPAAKARFSKTFTRAYPDAELRTVTPKNYWEFCGIQ